MGDAALLLGLRGRPLVLASASPRRASLLADLGIPFRVRPPGVPEALLPGEESEAAAERLARAKAEAVGSEEAGSWVLAADTLVVVDGTPLGKPADSGDARRMLRLLSGRTHEVLTGVAVRTPEGGVRSGVERTRVRFARLGEGDLDALADPGEAMDKAGAYGIQGLASLVIEGIEGDYFNVVGLPLRLVRTLIEAEVRVGDPATGEEEEEA